ncbi:MAG: hypothetical protein U1F70_14235 [Candidatus Competibacteraceae bacterium]
MTNTTALPKAAQACLICQAPLPFSPARDDKLCGRGECEWRYALLRRRREVCAICGRPLATPELPTQVCAASTCRRAAAVERGQVVHERNQARYAALIEREVEQATRLRDRVMTAFGFREPGSFRLTVIPAATARLVNLPERRRRALRDHVNALIGQTAGLPAPPPVEEPVSPPTERESQVQAVLGKACACCQGFCCEGGGDRAYLTVETIQRIRVAHPGQRPRDILAAYLERVGHRTVEGSCVYHQADGCALPRALRADLCNRHFCKALVKFQRDLPATGPIRGFFVAADYGVLHAATLVHDSQALVVQGVKEPEP